MHDVVTQDPQVSRGSCDCLNVLWIPLYVFVSRLPYCGFSRNRDREVWEVNLRNYH